MADILRVTTPLINKNQAPELKPSINPAAQFPLQDTTRVNQPSSQSELLSQNNGMLQKEETSALLLNLLKDPSVTVSFLKSISSMEAMIRLLPANNNSFTQELEQLFSEMMVPAEDIAAEMSRQETASTFFKGDLFELLRKELKKYPGQNELKEATVSFLKAVTVYCSRKEMLGSIANSLKYLSDSLNSSRTLSEKLLGLAEKYESDDAEKSFRELLQETMEMLGEVEDSILLTDKTSKVVKMITYNLSRFNDNSNFLREAVSRMLQQLHGDAAREQFRQALDHFLHNVKNMTKKESSAIGVLTHILEKQASNEELMLMSSDRIEKIIYSLLSSPCNFTPLLHYVLPIQYENIQSFAEVWINPNGDEDERDRKPTAGKSIHMLLTFEIDGIGHFELDLFVRDKTIDFSLYCPKAYTGIYGEMESAFRACTGRTEYKIGKINVEKLDRPRSLMETFKSLPYKRTGVYVKV